MRGSRVYIAGHSAQAPDGSYAGPFGKVRTDISLDEAKLVARGAALSILVSLNRALGDLDRVTAWLMVNGMVNAEPGYRETGNVINGFSELILELYGLEIGQHARTGVGVAALPLNHAVVVAAEVEIAVLGWASP